MHPPRAPAHAASGARFSSFHTPKRQLLGHHAHAPPAWRAPPGALPHQLPGQGGPGGKGKHPAGAGAGAGAADVQTGSKIFLSRLPVDVGEKEVEELFKKTIGPLKESFLIYNSQGRSKGMAVVHFQRPGDAAAARAKYDGKIVDGRKPIKIEIVLDTVSTASSPQPTPSIPQPTSLLHRLGVSPLALAPSASTKSPPTGPSTTRGKRPSINVTPRPLPSAPAQPRAQTQPRQPQAQAPPTAPRHPRRVKKGPKRLKKVAAQRAAAATTVQADVNRKQLTVDDLDKEMEDYRAAAPSFGGEDD